MADNYTWEKLFPNDTSDAKFKQQHMDLDRLAGGDLFIVRDRAEKRLLSVEPDKYVIRVRVGDKVIVEPSFKINEHRLTPITVTSNPTELFNNTVMSNGQLFDPGQAYITFKTVDSIITTDEFEKIVDEHEQSKAHVTDADDEITLPKSTINTGNQVMTELQKLSHQIYKKIVSEYNPDELSKDKLVYYAAYAVHKNAKYLIPMTDKIQKVIEDRFAVLVSNIFKEYAAPSFHIGGANGTTDYKEKVDSLVLNLARPAIVKEYKQANPDEEVTKQATGNEATFERAKKIQEVLQFQNVEKEFTNLTPTEQHYVAYYIFDKIYDKTNPLNHNLSISSYDRNWYVKMRNKQINRGELISSSEFAARRPNIAKYIDKLVFKYSQTPDVDFDELARKNEEEYADIITNQNAQNIQTRLHNILNTNTEAEQEEVITREATPEELNAQVNNGQIKIADISAMIDNRNARNFVIEIANVDSATESDIDRFYDYFTFLMTTSELAKTHVKLATNALARLANPETEELNKAKTAEPVPYNPSALQKRINELQLLSYDELIELLSDEDFDRAYEEIESDPTIPKPKFDINGNENPREKAERIKVRNERTDQLIEEYAKLNIINELVLLGGQKSIITEVVDKMFATAKVKKTRGYLAKSSDIDQVDETNFDSEDDQIIHGKYIYTRLKPSDDPAADKDLDKKAGKFENPLMINVSKSKYAPAIQNAQNKLVKNPAVINKVPYWRAGINEGNPAETVEHNNQVYTLVRTAADNPWNKPTVNIDGYDYILNPDWAAQKEKENKAYRSSVKSDIAEANRQEHLAELNNQYPEADIGLDFLSAD